MKRKRALILTTTIILVLWAAGGVWLHIQKQQYARNRALIDALMRNDTQTAFAIVNAGADPNTPYDAPAADFLLQQFRRWLHRSPDPVFGSPTAFMLSCADELHVINGADAYAYRSEQEVTLVQAMLAHGANMRARDLIGKSALVYAISNGRVRVAELLLKQSMSVNAPDGQGKTPLHYAVTEKNESMVRLLLAHGAGSNAPDGVGNPPLHYAVGFNCPASIFQMLLAHGADSNRLDKYGQTPLMLAQKLKRSDLVALLRRGGK